MWNVCTQNDKCICFVCEMCAHDTITRLLHVWNEFAQRHKLVWSMCEMCLFHVWNAFTWHVKWFRPVCHTRLLYTLCMVGTASPLGPQPSGILVPGLYYSISTSKSCVNQLFHSILFLLEFANCFQILHLHVHVVTSFPNFLINVYIVECYL